MATHPHPHPSPFAPSFTYLRRPDWQIRWVEFIKDSLDLASDLCIDWETDGLTCVSWMGDGVEVLTGHNPYDIYRGRHSGVLGAARLIRKEGFRTLDDWVASLFHEIPLSMLHQGDVVLVKTAQWCGDDAHEGPLFAEEIMPHGVALADPPLYWAVTDGGLSKGNLFLDGVRGFAVGRSV